MVSDNLLQRVTTVLTGSGEQIHLAVVRSTGRTDLGKITLCGRPAKSPVGAQRFHRLGCRECAAEAVNRGFTAIQDLEHATVNLPRFLAHQCGHDAPGGVPEQRGGQSLR